MSVTKIALLCKKPRTSVNKALNNLEKIGLIQSKKIRNKNQHVYARQERDSLLREIENIKTLVLGDHDSYVAASSMNDMTFTFLDGKEKIVQSLQAMVSIEGGERVYTIQSSGMTKKWVEKFGEEVIVNLHEELKKNNLIVISLQGDKHPQEFNYSRDVLKSFKDRLSVSHVISDDYIEKNTALYVYRTTVLFVNIESLNGFLMKDKHFSSALKKLITFSIQKSERARNLFSEK